MPNWCSTTYIVTGKTKDLNTLYKAIKACEESKTPRVENGFGKLWLGCIIDCLGGDWEKYRCRGEIIDFSQKDSELIIEQWTAWCEQEGFREFIEEKFPTAKVYFRDEEPGLENYTTNSFEDFSERYFLDASEESMYFETIEEASRHVEKLVGHKVEADIHSIQQALSDYEDEHKEDNYSYYGFHEFKLVDDQY